MAVLQSSPPGVVGPLPSEFPLASWLERSYGLTLTQANHILNRAGFFLAGNNQLRMIEPDLIGAPNQYVPLANEVRGFYSKLPGTTERQKFQAFREAARSGALAKSLGGLTDFERKFVNDLTSAASAPANAVDRFRDQYQQVRAATQQQLRNAWTTTAATWAAFGPTIPYTAYRRWLGTSIPLIQGGQSRVANMVGSYISVKGGADPRIMIPASVLENIRPGVRRYDTWATPAHQLGRMLREGHEFTDALRVTENTVAALAGMDLAMTMRDSFRFGMDRWNRSRGKTDTKFRYFRRVLSPGGNNCVTGDTIVRSGSDVQLITRRWYEGPLTTIHTASGNEITVTGNHPVLTVDGWRPAHLIQEGDEIFSAGALQNEHLLVDVGSPDEENVPTPIEDVFRSLASVRPVIRMPVVSEDFHGDGAFDSEVDIVAANGLFSGEAETERFEPTTHEALGLGHGSWVFLPGKGALTESLLAVGHSATSFVGSSDLLHPLFGAEGSHLHPGDITDGALLDTGFIQSSVHGSPVDTEAFSDGVGGLTTEVRGGDVLAGDGVSGFPAKFEAPPGEFSPDSIDAYTRQGRRLARRLAGQIQLDRVVFSRTVDDSTHVYNLQTREGWYVGNGIINSNCGLCVAASTQLYHTDELLPLHRNCSCTVMPILAFDDEVKQVIDKDRIDYIRDNASEYTRDELRGWRDIHGDSLPSSLVIDQRQLGPVLVSPTWSRRAWNGPRRNFKAVNAPAMPRTEQARMFLNFRDPREARFVLSQKTGAIEASTRRTRVRAQVQPQVRIAPVGSPTGLHGVATIAPVRLSAQLSVPLRTRPITISHEVQPLRALIRPQGAPSPLAPSLGTIGGQPVVEAIAQAARNPAFFATEQIRRLAFNAPVPGVVHADAWASLLRQLTLGTSLGDDVIADLVRYQLAAQRSRDMWRGLVWMHLMSTDRLRGLVRRMGVHARSATTHRDASRFFTDITEEFGNQITGSLTPEEIIQMGQITNTHLEAQRDLINHLIVGMGRVEVEMWDLAGRVRAWETALATNSRAAIQWVRNDLMNNWFRWLMWNR